MKDCLFCKIVNGENPSHKLYEDDDYLGILDIFPNSEGLTLVIPKKHLPGDAFEIEDKEYSKLMLAAKKIAKLLEKKLGNIRVALVIEGLEIDHVHIKLYPLHGVKKGKFVQIVDKEKPVFFKRYPGYITTIHGPRADDEKLKKLAEKIFRFSR